MSETDLPRLVQSLLKALLDPERGLFAIARDSDECGIDYTATDSPAVGVRNHPRFGEDINVLDQGAGPLLAHRESIAGAQFMRRAG